jgi:hypothetical protein
MADFGGTANSSEYEYWVTVDREDLRKALGTNVDEDLPTDMNSLTSPKTRE